MVLFSFSSFEDFLYRSKYIENMKQNLNR